ncbi:hypothetical protein H4F17_08865 [Vibrio cholerae]
MGRLILYPLDYRGLLLSRYTKRASAQPFAIPKQKNPSPLPLETLLSDKEAYEFRLKHTLPEKRTVKRR